LPVLCALSKLRIKFWSNDAVRARKVTMSIIEA
jgi:hypothetical protein